jgi:hypothetical protein
MFESIHDHKIHRTQTIHDHKIHRTQTDKQWVYFVEL